MMIAVAIAMAAASPEAVSQPTIPAFFTGQKLLEICTGDHSGQCWMYVAGVLDGLFLSQSGDTPPTICARTVTNQEAAERVTGFLQAHADMRERAAAVAVKAAMADALACPAPQSGAETSGGKVPPPPL